MQTLLQSRLQHEKSALWRNKFSSCPAQVHAVIVRNHYQADTIGDGLMTLISQVMKQSKYTRRPRPHYHGGLERSTTRV